MRIRSMTIIIVFAVTFSAIGLACTPKLRNPNTGLKESDLFGVWEAVYGKDVVDLIEIRADGTYKQTYIDTKTGYKYETPWNEWKLEAFPDGRVWLYL